MTRPSLDTKKASESTINSRLSEPDTVSDLYSIDYNYQLNGGYALVFFNLNHI